MLLQKVIIPTVLGGWWISYNRQAGCDGEQIQHGWQGQGSCLFFWLELQFLELLDFAGKDSLGRSRRVDARRFDGDDKEAAVLEEVAGIHAYNTRLHGESSSPSLPSTSS